MEPTIRKTIRIPPELHTRIRREAHKNSRSQNDLILEALAARYPVPPRGRKRPPVKA
jgi:predicted transcriptional regulator